MVGVPSPQGEVSFASWIMNSQSDYDAADYCPVDWETTNPDPAIASHVKVCTWGTNVCMANCWGNQVWNPQNVLNLRGLAAEMRDYSAEFSPSLPASVNLDCYEYWPEVPLTLVGRDDVNEFDVTSITVSETATQLVRKHTFTDITGQVHEAVQTITRPKAPPNPWPPVAAVEFWNAPTDTGKLFKHGDGQVVPLFSGTEETFFYVDALYLHIENDCDYNTYNSYNGCWSPRYYPSVFVIDPETGDYAMQGASMGEQYLTQFLGPDYLGKDCPISTGPNMAGPYVGSHIGVAVYGTNVWMFNKWNPMDVLFIHDMAAELRPYSAAFQEAIPGEITIEWCAPLPAKPILHGKDDYTTFAVDATDEVESSTLIIRKFTFVDAARQRHVAEQTINRRPAPLSPSPGGTVIWDKDADNGGEPFRLSHYLNNLHQGTVRLRIALPTTGLWAIKKLQVFGNGGADPGNHDNTCPDRNSARGKAYWWALVSTVDDLENIDASVISHGFSETGWECLEKEKCPYWYSHEYAAYTDKPIANAVQLTYWGADYHLERVVVEYEVYAPPTLQGVPGDVTILGCQNVLAAPLVTAEDSFGHTFDVLLATTTFNGGITRTWTATDFLGNPVTGSQTISILPYSADFVPQVPPTDTLPTWCSPPPPAPAPTGFDGCSNFAVSVTTVEETPTKIVRTFAFTDASGMEHTKDQIFIRPAPPVAQTGTLVYSTPTNLAHGGAIDVSLPTNGDIWVIKKVKTFGRCTGDPYGHDNYCAPRGQARSKFYWQITTVGSGGAQVVLETTTQPPGGQYVCLPPQQCDYWDVRDYSVLPLAEQPLADFVLLYYWGGNYHLEEVRIEYEVYQGPPTFTGVPDDVTIKGCKQLPTPASVAAADLYGNDFTVSLTETDNAAGVLRTWSFDDFYDTTHSVSQQVVIIPYEAKFAPPVPADFDLATWCAQLPLMPEPRVQATDGCEFFTVSFNEEEENTQWLRTWSFTDARGVHHEQTQQLIRPADVTKPTFPSNMAALAPPTDLECGKESIPTPLTLAEIGCTDNCDDPSELTLEVLDTEVSTTKTVRQYTLSDTHGNTAKFTQIFVVVDTIKPTWDQPMPENTVRECGVDQIPAQPEIKASDICRGSDLSVMYTQTDERDAVKKVGLITRRWETTDGQHPIFHEQIITVNDNNDPWFVETLPQFLRLECGLETALPAAELTAKDACTGPVDVFLQESSTTGPLTNLETITRTWTATDANEHVISHQQIVEFADTTPPAWVPVVMPENITLECGEEDLPAVPEIKAYDDCMGYLTVAYSQVADISPVTSCGTYTRTWKAMDPQGFSFEHVEVITYEDTLYPEFVEDLPKDDTLECGVTPLPGPPEITATDTCVGAFDVAYEQIAAIDPDTNCGTYARTWTAEDPQGYQISHTQVITYEDTIYPEFVENLPKDDTLECGVTPLPGPPEITATDTCVGAIDVAYEQIAAIDPDTNCGTHTRTWTAEDPQGYQISHTQVITYEDTIYPEFVEDLPEDDTLECGVTPLPDPPEITATDTCVGAIDVAYEQVAAIDPDTNCGTYTRTWTAQDPQGHQISHVQVITYEDIIAPTLIPDAVEDESFLCELPVPEPPIISAEDHCDDNLLWDYQEVRTDGQCNGRYTLTRTWTVQDHSDNSNSLVQKVYVDDVNAPIIVEPYLEHKTHTCGASFSAGELANGAIHGEDACGSSEHITFVDDIVQTTTVHEATDEGTMSYECPHVMKRTWTMSDDCLNEVKQSQWIIACPTYEQERSWFDPDGKPRPKPDPQPDQSPDPDASPDPQPQPSPSPSPSPKPPKGGKKKTLLARVLGQEAKNVKVFICHEQIDEELGTVTWKRLHVSENALKAHLGPDSTHHDYYPGTRNPYTDVFYDCNCDPLE